MSGSFDISADASVNMTAGSAGAVGSGAFTIAVLVQPTTGNNNCGFIRADASGVLQRCFKEDTLHLFGDNDFSSGFGNLTQGNWYLCVISKPSGSNPFRFHLWAYASDGSGTMSHGTATGAGNHADGSTADAIRIGIADARGNGLIAAVGLWTSALSDGQLDTLVSTSLATWAALSPTELISLENWNGSTGAATLVGTSSQSSITGTVGTGANPPSFTFALTSTVEFGAARPNQRHPGRGPSTARFVQTPRSYDLAFAAQASADVATVTGAAADAVVDLAANADFGTAAAVAADASADVRVNAENTTGSVAANDATVSTAAQTSANAENATGSAAANDAVASVQPNAGNATGSAGGNDASSAVAVPGDVAGGSAAGNGPAAAIAAAPSESSGSGAALDAVVVFAFGTEVATVAGVAFAPTVSTGGPGLVGADVATATGAAYNARTRREIPRPSSGTTPRPGSGTTLRPFSGSTQRP